MFDKIWKFSLYNIKTVGNEVKSRAGVTKEISPYHFIVPNIRNRLIFNYERKLSLGYAFIEFLWIISGQNDVRTLERYNSKMIEFSDDKFTLYGAYGKRLRGNFDQITTIINKLRDDLETRQAIATIWNPELDNKKSKDIPCTICFHFLVRNNKLRMYVYMRSNDIIRGTSYDVFVFTMIQEVIATYLGIDIGEYHHFAGSLHLYEEDFEWADKILEVNDYEVLEMPKMTGGKNVINILFCLFNFEKMIWKVNLKFEEYYKIIKEDFDEYWQNIALIFLFYRFRNCKELDKMIEIAKLIHNSYKPFLKRVSIVYADELSNYNKKLSIYKDLGVKYI